MLIIKFINILLFTIIMMISLLFVSTNDADAKEVFVNTEEEFDAILKNISEDTTIKLNEGFHPVGGPLGIFYESNYKVTIDGQGNNFIFNFYTEVKDKQEVVYKNIKMDGTNKPKDSYDEGLRLVFSKGGKIKVENCEFTNIEYKKEPQHQMAPIHAFGEEGDLEIDDVLINNIDLESKHLIDIQSEKMNVKISNTTIQNNFLGSNGAIYVGYPFNSERPPITGDYKVEINNVMVKNNTNGTDNSKEIPGFLIEMDGPNAKSISIKNIFIENNKLIEPGTVELKSVGTAGVYLNLRDGIKAEISGSTFANNETAGSSAVWINNYFGEVEELKVTNNTFFNNVSKLKHPFYNTGGAILLNILKEGPEKISITNNTVYKNSIDRNIYNSQIPEAAGAGFNLDTGFENIRLVNNLLVGNFTKGNAHPRKTFENVYSVYKVSNEKSLGVDNGKLTLDTVGQLYGKYPVVLSTFGNEIKAGRKKDGVVIPTLPIAPKLTNSNGLTITGTGNMTGTVGTEYDQRGIKREGKSDIGSIEITSLIHDANGGNFTLKELGLYDGRIYYEGKNPGKYAKIGISTKPIVMIDATKELKPVKKGYKFIGWSESRIDNVADSKYSPNKKVNIKDQKIIYAVWKENKYKLSYLSNGKTSGSVPIQKAVGITSAITIKTQGKMKRKGYKFSGWSTKPSAKKGEAAYAPGMKLKLTKNTKLYAIWKR